MTRVVLCDDAIGFPELVAAWLDAADGIELVGRTPTWSGLEALLPDARPDVVLLDFMLPEGPADPARIAAIRRLVPGVRVVLVSSLPAVQLEDQARRLQVDAWCPKTTGAPQLLAAVTG